MKTDALEIRRLAGKGRGVFARRAFATGEIIERCPVIAMPEEQWEQLDRTRLESYCFKWGPALQDAAVALGYGSLYNHSFSPNAVYTRVLSDETVDFTALRNIVAGEEITVNYNDAPDDRKPVWFTPIE